MRGDPPVRADGLCAQCDKPRTRPRRPQKGVDPASYLRDPFCSTSCARAYYDNPLPPMLGGRNLESRQGRHERAA